VPVVVVFQESGIASGWTGKGEIYAVKALMIVVGGGLRVDYLITQDGQAYCGMAGGNALYAAVGAALWSGETGLWGRIGNNYPVQWLEELHSENIRLEGIKKLPGIHDHRTFFAYMPDGRRDDTRPATHFDRIGQPLPDELAEYVHSTPGQDDPDHYEPLALRPADWPSDYDGAIAVHLSPLCLRTHLRVPPFLRERGVRLVSVDPGERYMVPELTPYVRQVLSQIDVFLPSESEVRSLFGEDVSLVTAAQEFVSWGPRWVVIKCGVEGILVVSRQDNQVYRFLPWHKSGDFHVVDVTGAGDAFCGGFMSGLASGKELAAAAAQGLVSASLVIEGYGALYALGRDREEAWRRVRQLISASD